MDRETATMLAALRLWQIVPARNIPRDILEIANQGRTVPPLLPREVEKMIEQIQWECRHAAS